jgi:TRAP transporter TAXI family solute receptor
MRLTLATGGTAGTYYPYGGAIAQIISEKTGIVEITAQATGATGENLNLLAAGDVDMALVQNDLSYYAYNGLEIFKDNPVKNVRGIARLYPEVIHVVAQANSGIKTIADFKGKRISLGASGSGNEANCRQIFEFYNLDPEYKDLTPYFISYAETTDHFKDLQIDAFVYTTGVPSPSIMDITLLQEAAFVPIDGEVRDKIIEKYPFFTAETLPAGSYKGLDNDLGTVAVQCILVVSEALSEDTVYAMTKALFENLEELGNAHAKGKEVFLERAIEGVTVPLHPGAEKYYKEVGLIK